jgi:hypothetical protein
MSNGKIRACLVAALAVGVTTSTAHAQASDTPVVVPMIPYEQGMASIQAQDAARPKAVQPILAPKGGNEIAAPQPKPVPETSSRPPH